MTRLKSSIERRKQRHGPTGIVELQFDESLTKFQNLIRNEYLPEKFG